MSLPLIALLWFYLLGVFIVLLFGLSSLYHLLRFGFFSQTSVAMTFLLIAGTVLILFFSYRLISPFDWSQSFDVWGFFVSLKPF